jgi:hypothetical protein
VTAAQELCNKWMVASGPDAGSADCDAPVCLLSLVGGGCAWLCVAAGWLAMCGWCWCDWLARGSDVFCGCVVLCLQLLFCVVLGVVLCCSVFSVLRCTSNCAVLYCSVLFVLFCHCCHVLLWCRFYVYNSGPRLCCSVLFCVVLCCSVLFCVVLCLQLRCSVVFSVSKSGFTLCCSVLFCVVLCCSVLFFVVLQPYCVFSVCFLCHYRSVLFVLFVSVCPVLLFCVVLNCSVLFCGVLWCSVLCCSLSCFLCCSRSVLS